MRIAIATEGTFVSAHFGRCPAYTLLDIEEGQVVNRNTIPNPGHQPGFLPKYLAEQGATCIIAGGMGPRAQGLFAAHNITTITGVQGSLDEVIDKYLRQELSAGEDLCGHRHGEEHSCQHEEAPSPAAIPAGAKICITAKDKTWEADVDPRFGRAAYFLLLDPTKMEMEAIQNPFQDAAQGAGIQSAQLIAEKGVRILFTGEVGPKAGQTLESAGIQTITGISGTVQAVLQNFAKEVK
jgi:predicted Fe-Mo cluster-binding NifX family protein